MRVLHLFANWKWTGPAEPAVQTCLALKQAGVDVAFIAGTGPDGQRRTVADHARELGLNVLPGSESRPVPLLPKHARPLATALDVLRLRNLLAEQEPFDLLHCHLPNDHLIGGLAARPLGLPIVRTFYEGEARGLWRERFLASRYTDLALAPSARTQERLARYKRLKGRVAPVETPIDLARFHAAGAGPSPRAAWGVPPEAPVFGLVARIQARRRFDLLLDAAAALAKAAPQARIVVIGRGTHQAEILEEPARRMGLQDVLRPVGYAEGEDYVAALADLDGLIYLVPGTDGSCRTVREAMAMGLPVVATRRGILPELVEDSVTGFLVDETPESLSGALARLAADPALRARLGAEARRSALARFDPAAVARTIIERYQALLLPFRP